MAGALPWLIFAATLLLATIKSSTASRMAKPGCRETCGNLTIPYPFGIGQGCFRDGLDVSCENNTLYRHNSTTSKMKIYNIDLLGGQTQVNTFIASNCFYSKNNFNTDGWASLNTGQFFTVSSKANKLTVVGCSTLAFLVGNNEHSSVGAGCFSMCGDKKSVDPSGQCSGMGCCQTSIASNVFSSNITFDVRFNNSEASSFNPCSYAFVAEQDWFKFKASYLDDDKFIKEFKDGVPTVLDWVAGYENCTEAVKNTSSYACISKNSQCIESTNATGYLCTCNDGFAGNPYLEEGCQDLDECSFPDQYPCHGICSNTIGNYSCLCKSGTRSTDPKRDTCNPIELTKVSTDDINKSMDFLRWSTLLHLSWPSTCLRCTVRCLKLTSARCDRDAIKRRLSWHPLEYWLHAAWYCSIQIKSNRSMPASWYTGGPFAVDPPT